jgi:hypothetical protein
MDLELPRRGIGAAEGRLGERVGDPGDEWGQRFWDGAGPSDALSPVVMCLTLLERNRRPNHHRHPNHIVALKGASKSHPGQSSMWQNVVRRKCGAKQMHWNLKH